MFPDRLACSDLYEMVESLQLRQNWCSAPNLIVDAIALITFSFQKMSVRMLCSKSRSEWDEYKNIFASSCLWEIISKYILTRLLSHFNSHFRLRCSFGPFFGWNDLIGRWIFGKQIIFSECFEYWGSNFGEIRSAMPAQRIKIPNNFPIFGNPAHSIN